MRGSAPRSEVRLTVAALLLCWHSIAAAQGGSATVRGVVRDSAAHFAIAGAIIDVRDATFQSAVRSDESGAFSIGAAPAGLYHLTILRIGYRKIVRDIAISNGDAPLSIYMVPVAQSLAPILVGAEGAGIFGVVGAVKDLRPLSGIKVFVAGANQTIVTDSVGGFFVPVKKPGTYIVQMSGKGYGEELFPIDVPAEHVVDASRLLDESDEPPISGGLMQDFDQRLRWRGNNSALVSGSEIRRAGGGLIDGLNRSPSFLAKGLRFGPMACVIVDGVPHPDWSPDEIRPEEIEAVEVYASDREVITFLSAYTWPKGARCGATGRTVPNRKAPEVIKYVVIWTRR